MEEQVKETPPPPTSPYVEQAKQRLAQAQELYEKELKAIDKLLARAVNQDPANKPDAEEVQAKYAEVQYKIEELKGLEQPPAPEPTV